VGEQTEEIDFAVAAYREEGAWQVQEIAHTLIEDVDSLAESLRRFPGDHGALGLVAVDEDFFLIARVAGPDMRLLLSDATAADEWELAGSALERLGLPLPEDDDDPGPAGDLELLGDLGMNAIDLGLLFDDYDLYPDEALSRVAAALGFGPLFDVVVGLTSA
jgi:putative tRNA adenosine deaminase-associated protein